MSRCLLHKTCLDEFRQWLDAHGIQHRPGRGDFQVLQVRVPTTREPNRWAVVYDRIAAKEHYTVTEPLEATVQRFVRERRQQWADAVVTGRQNQEGPVQWVPAGGRVVRMVIRDGNYVEVDKLKEYKGNRR